MVTIVSEAQAIIALILINTTQFNKDKSGYSSAMQIPPLWVEGKQQLSLSVSHCLDLLISGAYIQKGLKQEFLGNIKYDDPVPQSIPRSPGR